MGNRPLPQPDEQQLQELRDLLRPTPTKSAWGEPISAERKTELDSMLRGWRASPTDESGPYTGIDLTGGDVFYIAARALVGPDSDPGVMEENLRAVLDAGPGGLGDVFFSDQPNLLLDGAELNRADLRRALLRRARLTGAHMWGAFLQNTVLSHAHLEQTFLESANLDGAVLDGAALVGAILHDASLRAANLVRARLDDADLGNADLERADLRGAYFSRRTRLGGVNLAGALLDQALFDGTDLTVVDWDRVHVIGDEEHARATTRKERSSVDDPGPPQLVLKDANTRAEEYGCAARAYRTLAVALRAQGLAGPSGRFNARAELMDCFERWHAARVAFGQRGNVVTRLVRGGLGAVSAGTRWALYGLVWLAAHLWALVVLYAAVVLLFTLLYLVAGHTAHTGLTFGDALELSVTSFHGRGLQPGSHLTGGMRAFAAVEAPMGLVVEGLFVAGLVRRVTGAS